MAYGDVKPSEPQKGNRLDVPPLDAPQLRKEDGLPKGFEEHMEARKKIHDAYVGELDGNPLPGTGPRKKPVENKESNFFKDNSGLIIGGGALLISLLTGGKLLMSLLIGALGMFVGNTFGPPLVDMISGKKDLKKTGPGLEKEIIADEINIKRVKNLTGMDVTAEQISAANTDNYKDHLSRKELAQLALEYQRETGKTFSFPLEADAKIEKLGGHLPLAKDKGKIEL